MENRLFMILHMLSATPVKEREKLLLILWQEGKQDMSRTLTLRAEKGDFEKILCPKSHLSTSNGQILAHFGLRAVLMWLIQFAGFAKDSGLTAKM